MAFATFASDFERASLKKPGKRSFGPAFFALATFAFGLAFTAGLRAAFFFTAFFAILQPLASGILRNWQNTRVTSS